MRAREFGWSGSWSVAPVVVGAELDSPQTLVLVFADREVAQELIAEVVAAFPAATVVGCSTAGQISGDQVSAAALLVAAIRFERARPRAVGVRIAPGEASRSVGERLAAALCDEPGTMCRNVFVISDGLHVNGSELVAGLTAGLPAGAVISGGLAGDAADFGQTWVLIDGEAQEDAVVAVDLAELAVSHGCAGGWEGFGPHRTITRSDGNVLYELDGRPALELYKEYLGELAAGLPGAALMFPLAIESDERPEPTVRTVLAVDEGEQSMTFAGDVPEGFQARLMRTTVDWLVEGAYQAARSSAQHGGTSLSIAVSCVGRRLMLGARVDEELEAALEALGEGLLVGFYSYGEMSPTQGACHLHNQTMTITTITEPAPAGDIGPERASAGSLSTEPAPAGDIGPEPASAGSLSTEPAPAGSGR
jgi:hypothetical protein